MLQSKLIFGENIQDEAFVVGRLLVSGCVLLIYRRLPVGYGTLCTRLWVPGKYMGAFLVLMGHSPALYVTL